MIKSLIQITSSIGQFTKAMYNVKLVMIDIKRELTLLDYEQNRVLKLIALKKLQIKLNNFQS